MPEGGRGRPRTGLLDVEDGRVPPYCAASIRGDEGRSVPAWLAERLSGAASAPSTTSWTPRSTSCWTSGNPCTHLDLRFLAGRAIRVRRAWAGAPATLDGIERELVPEDVVIADAERAVALAGIMGGADSESRPDTTEVLLESAFFDPMRVRRTARRLGLSTEASHRFERGADRAMARVAADLAAELIVRLAGGEVAAGVPGLLAGASCPPTRSPWTANACAPSRGATSPRPSCWRCWRHSGCEPRASGDEITSPCVSHVARRPRAGRGPLRGGAAPLRV